MHSVRREALILCRDIGEDRRVEVPPGQWVRRGPKTAGFCAEKRNFDAKPAKNGANSTDAKCHLINSIYL